jgi:mono/diheme cytochrome c family protein
LAAAPTSKQRTTINTLKRKAKQAEDKYNAGDFNEAGTALRNIQKQYDALLEEAEKEKGLFSLLEPLYNEMLRTHALLELEGITLPELKKPVPGDQPGTVSFTKNVAPILVAKCGRCHVDNARGMFSMASYESLMKGSDAGKVIFPKDADGSRFIEIIVSGDMPRGGLKVEPDELTVLKTWVAEGAKYDGKDPQRRITEFAPNARPTSAPPVPLARATGKETISFSNDLAAVIADNCVGCHGGGQQVAGQFNLATFETMLRGGNSGPVLVPKKAADSLLVKKLKGTAAGDRMPRGLPPLADDVIAKFETWVNEGAAFDGTDPKQNVVAVAALAKTARSTHEELSKDRERLAQQNWQLGMPSATADQALTKNFLLLGNVGSAALAEQGEAAKKVAKQVAEILKVPSGQPLIKGRMTLFVFRARYDYSEFGMMVEKRQMSVLFTEHSMDVVFAYADRIIVLARGVLIADGNAEAIRDNREVQAVYLGTGSTYKPHAGAPP